MIDDSHSTVQAESDALCDNGYTCQAQPCDTCG